jgi:hypothetical protein
LNLGTQNLEQILMQTVKVRRQGNNSLGAAEGVTFFDGTSFNITQPPQLRNRCNR